MAGLVTVAPPRGAQPTAAREAERRSVQVGWLERAAPWAVFGFAAALRLGALDLAAFTYDEADVILRARALANGELPLSGALTSWGIPDPPLLIYLLASVARAPSPVLATLGLMALINSVAVLGTYMLAARYFGWRCGLAAGLLYAVNPWAIYFGRRAWSEVQPALTVVALWSAFELVVGRRPRFGLVFLLALAAGVQARLVALAYAPAAVGTLMLAGRIALSRWSLLGLVGGGLLSAPYVGYLIASRSEIAQRLAEGNRGVVPLPRAGVLKFIWWLVSGENLLPTPPNLSVWLDRLGAILRVEALLAAGVLLVGLGLCLFTCARWPAGWKRYGLLLCWAVLPLALVTWQSSTVYLHYLVLLLPLPFLLMALPIDALLGRSRAGWLGVVLLLSLVLPQAAAWIALQKTLMTYDTAELSDPSTFERRMLFELARDSAQRLGTGESYGVEVPVRFWLAANERVRAALVARPRELLAATKGSDPLSEDRPAMLAAALDGDIVAHYQPAESLLLPLGRPALLLMTQDADPPVLPERLGQLTALVPLPGPNRAMREGIRLFNLPARSAAEWMAALGAAGRGQSGVAASTTGRVHYGETLEVVTLWPGPATAIRPSVVILDAGGQVLPERESPRRRPVDVAADQLLLTRHQVPVSNRAVAGEARLVAERVVDSGPSERIDLGPVVVLAR